MPLVPDNLDVFAPLPEAAVLSLDGADAIAFAHAQFASDVVALASGHWHWSCWLNPKGRVIRLFLLARIDDSQLLLILPDGDATPLAEQLRRFVFRRKLRIEARADLSVEACLERSIADGNRIGDDAGRWLFDLGTPALARTLAVTPADNDTPVTPAASAAWRQIDLRMGLPRLSPDQREQWTPQQIGLDRLAAYSVRKGCYPGQEIVARTHFLGKAKRSVRLLELSDAAQPGDEVCREQQAIGSIASVATGLALAVLPLEGEEDGLTVRGQPARVTELLEGLAR